MSRILKLACIIISLTSCLGEDTTNSLLSKEILNKDVSKWIDGLKLDINKDKALRQVAIHAEHIFVVYDERTASIEHARKYSRALGCFYLIYELEAQSYRVKMKKTMQELNILKNSKGKEVKTLKDSSKNDLSKTFVEKRNPYKSIGVLQSKYDHLHDLFNNLEKLSLALVEKTKMLTINTSKKRASYNKFLKNISGQSFYTHKLHEINKACGFQVNKKLYKQNK